jgi:hypothetical protein
MHINEDKWGRRAAASPAMRPASKPASQRLGRWTVFGIGHSAHSESFRLLISPENEKNNPSTRVTADSDTKSLILCCGCIIVCGRWVKSHIWQPWRHVSGRSLMWGGKLVSIQLLIQYSAASATNAHLTNLLLDKMANVLQNYCADEMRWIYKTVVR